MGKITKDWILAISLLHLMLKDQYKIILMKKQGKYLIVNLN